MTAGRNESSRYDPKENVSRHAVSHPNLCRQMASRYDWTLLRVEPTNTRILEFDCVFEGKTEFPSYFQENEDDE